MEAEPSKWKAIVTGGAAGLGAAVVSRLCDLGADVAVLDRKAPATDVRFTQVDLADAAAADLATRLVVEEMGSLDVVVTSAGIDVPGRLDEVAAEDWNRVLAVNLLGTAAVVRAALPELRRTHGRIVTVASTLAHRGVSDATAYCASKFGVVGFTRALMAEVRDEVGVTLLTPGGMTTEFFDGRTEQYRPPADARLADPAHVAESVLFALRCPAGVEVKELVVTGPSEGTWP